MRQMEKRVRSQEAGKPSDIATRRFVRRRPSIGTTAGAAASGSPRAVPCVTTYQSVASPLVNVNRDPTPPLCSDGGTSLGERSQSDRIVGDVHSRIYEW
mmetsp:Transcript_49921/g.147185  ORF Transcript_49921/g.147185 Transcript_49921/m.147185 type:complete len:99 (+) Transcript_49921:579-875(+)